MRQLAAGAEATDSTSQSPNEEALQRQLAAARTRIRNLIAEKNAAWAARDEALAANPVTITKAQLAKLKKVSAQTRRTTPPPPRARRS